MSTAPARPADAAAPRPSYPLRPPATLFSGLFGVWLLVEAGTITLLFVLQLPLVALSDDGHSYTLQRSLQAYRELLYNVAHLLDQIGLLVLIGLAATAIAWLVHARLIAEALRPQRHSLGWAIGGWVVPVLSLWYPKQVLDDVWLAGTAFLPADLRAGRPVLTTLWCVAFWLSWVLRLASIVSSYVLGPLTLTYVLLRLGSEVLLIVSGALFLGVLWRITNLLDPRRPAVPPWALSTLATPQAQPAEPAPEFVASGRTETIHPESEQPGAEPQPETQP